MIFDRALKAAELGFTPLFKFLRGARLFEIPKRPQDFLPSDAIPPDELELLRETFFLPFKTVAVEDPCSCIIIQDTEDDARGMDKKRIWVEIMPQVSERPEVYIDDVEETRRNNEINSALGMSKDLIIIFGTINSLDYVYDGAKPRLDATVGQLYVYDDRQRTTKNVSGIAERMGDVDDIAESSGRNVITALEEVMWINDPDHFVLEETPERAIERRKRSGSKKRREQIPRSYERPKYTIMRPHNIRKRMGLPEPDAPSGIKRRPHDRRAHYRKLQSDKFVHKKGQWVPVTATWVGPKENKVGGKRYKVIVDLRGDNAASKESKAEPRGKHQIALKEG